MLCVKLIFMGTAVILKAIVGGLPYKCIIRYTKLPSVPS